MGRAAIESTPLKTPLVGRPQHTFARLDRAEATEKYLGDRVLALIERVERLEAEVARLRDGS